MELRATICEAILAIQGPFTTTDLFSILERDHSIHNRSLALSVLDDLCDSETIRFGPVNSEVYAFYVAKKKEAG